MNLTGKVLVARPALTDRYFKTSVVFVYEHGPSAIAGLILNKITTTNLQTICVQKGLQFVATDNMPVYCGGPVNESAMFVLHTSEWNSRNTMGVTPSISISSDEVMIEKLAQGNNPRGAKLISGMSVWHPQQLQDEMNKNMWLITDLTDHEVFDLHGRTQWDHAVNRTANQMIDKLFA